MRIITSDKQKFIEINNSLRIMLKNINRVGFTESSRNNIKRLIADTTNYIIQEEGAIL